MGFDKNTEGKPVVQVERRATKVNISMIIGVVLFFILGAIGMVLLHRRTPDPSPTILPSDQHPS
jgi:hypothetical protein